MKKYFIMALLIMLFVVIALIGQNKRIREDNRRLENNISVLNTDMEHYRTSLGQSVAQVGQLELTIQELKEYNADIEDRLAQLQLKLRRVKSLSLNAVNTTVQFTTPLAKGLEPVNLNQTYQFRWSDPWSKVEGIVSNDSVECSIQHCDTLDQIIYRVPKRFLFIRYGTKEIRQVISVRDPKSTIIYSEYIVLKRKKKISAASR